MNAPAHDGEPGFVLTAFVLFGGPAIWIGHLVVNAALVPAACARHVTWLLNVSTVVSAAVAAWSVAAAVMVARRYGTARERTQLLAFLGGCFGVISVMLIVLEGAPVLVLNECAR
jgi:hypothetical protein